MLHRFSVSSGRSRRARVAVLAALGVLATLLALVATPPVPAGALDSATTVRVTGSNGWRSAAVAPSQSQDNTAVHTCAVTTAGGVKCAGYNTDGQTGNGTTKASNPYVSDMTLAGQSPVAKSDTSAGQNVASLAGATCVIYNDAASSITGGVQCTGLNANGVLGDGTSTQRTAPVVVTSQAPAVPANFQVPSTVNNGSLWTGSPRSGVNADFSVRYTKNFTPATSVSGFKIQGCTDDGGRAFITPSGGSRTQLYSDWNAHGRTCTTSSASFDLVAGTSYKLEFEMFDSGSEGDAELYPVTPAAAPWDAKSWKTEWFNTTGTSATTGGVTGSPVVTDPEGVDIGLSGVTSIVGGSYSDNAGHFCGLKNGGVYCWGRNGSGELGDGTQTSRSRAVVAVAEGSGVTSIAAGPGWSCAVFNGGASGTARCWGDNDDNQLGTGGSTSTDFTTPQQVKSDASTNLTGVVSLTAGGWSTCARMNDGSARCWGLNSNGQLGDASTTNRQYGVTVKAIGGSGSLANVTSIAGGNRHFCATTSNGQVNCWGYNNVGQLGTGNTTQATSPVRVLFPGQPAGGNPLTNVASTPGSIGGGYQISCAIRTDGSQLCWGNNSNGATGDGTTGNQSVPVYTNGAGPNLWSAAAVSGGLVNEGTGSHSCAVTTNKQVKCWGWGGLGQMGNNTATGFNPAPVQATLSTAQGSSPVAATSVANGSPIASSNAGSCVIVNTASITGGVQCWGRNLNGELGNNSSTSSNAPVAVVAGAGPSTTVSGTAYLSGVTAISSGQADGSNTAQPAHTCALANGGVYCWGYNKDGELGNGTTGTGVNSSPVQAIAQGSGVTGIALGNATSCALYSNGTSKCWGWNQYGQLATGDQANKSTPTTTVGASMSSISMGTFHQCVTTTSGGVYCAGRNANGELGNNTTTNSTTGFVQVKDTANSGFLTGATSVGAGLYGSCAVANGNVVCWGKDDYGKLGKNTVDSQSLYPVAVFGPGSVSNRSVLTGASTSTWGVLAPGSNQNCVRMASGAVNCWGRDVDGELGGGSSPTNDTAISGTASPAANAAGWNNSNITVSWTCTTNSPATVPSCGPSPVVVSAEGNNLSATGTAIDSSGYDAAITVNGLKLDKTAPTGTGTATAGPNGTNGWYTGNATFSWSCADTLSGVKTCPGNSTITGEGAALTTTATAVDNADNNGTLTSPTVKIDRTKPVTSVSSIPTWATSNVSVTLTPSDGLAGVASTKYTLDGGAEQTVSGAGAVNVPVTTDGVHTITYYATDLAGNVEATKTATVRIDKTAPTISASKSPLPNAGGWNNANVTVTFTCSDGTSGVASCTPPSAYTADTAGTLVNGTAVDVAGNSSGTSTTVKLDKTAPTSSADRSPAANGDGWNNTDVTVTYTCNDATSGIASCPPADVLSSEGADQSSSGSAVDAAGNATPASVTDINIDKTAPTISASVSGTPNAYGYRVAPVTVTFTCSDALSGLASGACPDPVVLNASGNLPVSGSVTDKAGNESVSSQFVKVSRPPTATGSSVTADRAVDTVFGLTGSDPDNEALTFTVVDPPARGTLSCDSAGSCTYRWVNGSAGSDSFTFKVDDGTADSSTATVDLTLVSGPAPTISGSRTPAANPNGWNNEPVTVTFTCGSSELATCTAPTTLSTDGADQSVTGTATDIYGQSSSTTVSDINIDQVAPTIIGLATTSPNAAGWYKAPVTMAWTCNDTLSGISAGVCPADSQTVGEGTAVSVSESVNDKAGNHASASSESVKIDRTAPSTGVSTPPTWSNSTVNLTLTATDALSGVATTEYRVDGGPTQTGTSPTVSGQGHHVVTYWSTDVAGNEEAHASVGVDIDTSAPTIIAHVAPAPNGNGWHKGDVDVTFTCGDTDSGVASCTGDASFTTEVDTVVTGHAADNAGNTATDTATVRIDRHDPTVTAQVPPANVHGWFNTTVQVPFSCTDTGGSGVDVCPAPAVFAGEGANQPVTGTGRDNAGNEGSASGSTVNVDLTAPTISGAAINGSNGNGGYYGSVTIRWTCDDALSGVVSCPADQVVSGEGSHTVSRSVNDKAGNTTSAEVTIRIDHDPSTDPGFVHGTITSSVGGAPIAGAYVSLRTPAGAVVLTTTTGTDGTYSFPTVADGTYKLYSVLAKAYQGAYTSSTFTVAHGTNRTVDQVLAPTLVVSGIVRSNGVPVSGATVRVAPAGVAVLTDSAGRYTATGLLPGSTTVSVFAFGHVPSTPATFNLTTDRTYDVALTASAAGTGAKGTITNRTTGAPIAGATVRVWVKDSISISQMITTGANGRYSLASLPVGTYEFDVIRGDYQVRWFGDVLSRINALPIAVSVNCATSPDTTWGDACAIPANIRMG